MKYFVEVDIFCRNKFTYIGTGSKKIVFPNKTLNFFIIEKMANVSVCVGQNPVVPPWVELKEDLTEYSEADDEHFEDIFNWNKKISFTHIYSYTILEMQSQSTTLHAIPSHTSTQSHP